MKRRDFLKAVTAIVAGGCLPVDALATLATIEKRSAESITANHDNSIKDYLHKMRNFNERHEGDFCLNDLQHKILTSSVNRLNRLQRIVGHGNFCLIDFDNALKISRNYSQIGKFSKEELNFLEMIFYGDSELYGFVGEKPLKNLTDHLRSSKVIKIPHTGNYLYKGRPLEIYKKIKKDIGEQAILTSGLRSVTKQFLLFLNKAVGSKGNLSIASRSLAPPGYSFHGIGDFDVGQIGFGAFNFTEAFTDTKVFKKLSELGYVDIRYPRDNLFGVRFEPWHIKVK